jgi:hypothetical protein
MEFHYAMSMAFSHCFAECRLVLRRYAQCRNVIRSAVHDNEPPPTQHHHEQQQQKLHYQQ